MEKPFILYLRRDSNGTAYYYYKIKDHRGRWIARSTRKQKKWEAEQYCWDLYNKGQLAIKASELSLRAYTENWFIYDVCPYIQPRVKRGRGFSRSHAETKRSFLVNKIWPYLGEMRLNAIQTYHIEDWLDKLKDQGYSHCSLNHYLKTLKLIFAEAERLRDVDYNPTLRVLNFSNTTKEKGVLTREEITALFFSHQALFHVWKDNLMQYAINIVAACTGMRMGEIMALQKDRIFFDHIIVDKAWDRKYGLKEPKTKRVRQIPIPALIYRLLVVMIHQQESGPFVFSTTGGKKPIDHKAIIKWHYQALENIGISPEQRKLRNLSFHSWRHFFNSTLRSGGIPDSITQAITGHKTVEMMDHYTHVQDDALNDVRRIQNNLIDDARQS